MNGTLQEGLSFAKPEAVQNDTHLKRVLQIACAEVFISGQFDGVDTLLGERGAGLF